MPEDHFMLEYSTEDSSRSGSYYIDNLGLEKNKGVPQEILYSARFMDGLSADSQVYSEFEEDFAGPFNFDTNGIWWHQKFVHHARIVFDFLKYCDSHSYFRISGWLGNIAEYVKQFFTAEEAPTGASYP